MEKTIKYSILIFILSIITVHAQHSVQWLKNENFTISSDQYTIVQKAQTTSAHLISKHYLDTGEDGYIEIYNLEDLKDFSVYLESEDKLGNTKKSYGLLFNHILDENPSDNNQSLDSVIALQYSKYKLEKTTSKDGTKSLKTRDFKILDHGKLTDELDDPNAPIAVPFSYAKTIRIEKVGNQIFIKKNGEILKTFNNVLQSRYRIGVHSYIIDPSQINQISIDTNFSNTSEALGVQLSTGPVITCVDSQINLDYNWTSKCSYDITGRVIGSGISYFNALGKPTQTQSIDLKTQKIWMSQLIYDSRGRVMFNSSSAPIGDNFGYKEDFIKKEDGSILTKEDLENLYVSPKLGDANNTLGKYYSENNDTNILGSEYHDVTAYPYSRTIFSELNPGAVLKTVGGKRIDFNNDGDPDNDDWKQGFSYTTPENQELYYIFGKNYFEEKLNLNEVLSIEEPIVTSNEYHYYNCEYFSTDCDTNFGEDVFKFKGYLTIGTYYNGKINFPGLDDPIRMVKILEEVSTPTFPILTPKIENISGPWTDCSRTVKFSQINNDLNQIVNNPNQHLIYKQAYKTVSIDLDGNESVIFTDAEGKILASGRSGGINSQEVVSLIGEQGYVDIHIPKNTNGYIQFFGNMSDYSIRDLRTELPIVMSNNLLPGFYRIQAEDSRYKDRPTLTYIDGDNNIQPAFPNYNMGVRYKVNYYDFSVNYYDKLGNLKKNVQPRGFDNNNLDNQTFNFPNHAMMSTFEYNSVGQLLETTSPDEGQAKFLYREDGQIRFSQNSKQSIVNEVSYTNYDNLGRPIESGVVSTNFEDLDPKENEFSGNRKEQHFTFYDLADENLKDQNNLYLLDGVIPALSLADLLTDQGIPADKYEQSFLASNVSVTYAKPSPNEPITNLTWYSYDIYGRVKWLVQYVTGLGIKTIDYVYDPVTSNVTDVIYQKYKPREYFAHKYEYDYDTNQLIKVFTSYIKINGEIEEMITTQHVEYSYYENGALRRTQYANQGIDYVYNLNGQLKSINHPSLDSTKDPGGDPNDLFGLAIDYYNGDYTRSNTPTPVGTTSSGNNMYNGNIKALRWKTNGLAVPNHSDGDITVSNAQVFTYNDKYWLEAAEFGIADTSNANINLLANGSYNVFGIDYDKNGNIKHLNRNAIGASNAMDRLSYSYKPNSNQLDYVADTVTQDTGLEDIKNQAENNYTYNSIGQLIQNNQDNIIYEYNASGLVTKISKFNADTNGYQIIFENNYDEQYNIDKIDGWNYNESIVVMDIQDFTKETNVEIKGEYYSDFCEELAKNNVHGLSFIGNENFEVIRDLSLETEGEYIVSFDAILKRLTQLGAQSINLNISILDENGQLITNTSITSNNNTIGPNIICGGLYDMKNISLGFTATTDMMHLKIEASSSTSDQIFGFIIDNFKIEKYTTETALKFYYDDKGKRIRKEIFSNDGNTRDITYYVRDASGSPIGIYSNTITAGQRVFPANLEEQAVYGLNRLGLFKHNSIFPGKVSWDGYTYELTDHLGNVRATFINAFPYMIAKVTNATDYYPFGMPMPLRRIHDANNYRYAYQGQEKDIETGKEAFELRLWDGRIGRWLTTDPYGQHYSPYTGMGNNPVSGVDGDGGWDTKFGRWLSWAAHGFQGSSSDFFQNDNGQYGIAFDVANGSGAGDLTGTYMAFSGGDFAGANSVSNSMFDFQGNIQATIGPAQGNFWEGLNNSNGIDGGFFGRMAYSTANGFSVSAQTLNPFDKQLANLDGSGVVRGSWEHQGASVDAMASAIPIGKGVSVTRKAVGPLKQWVRVGRSYSVHGQFQVQKSIRWGASPARNGKYLNQIGSPTMRRFNQWLRGLRLPGNSWKVQDAGHFHIRR